MEKKNDTAKEFGSRAAGNLSTHESKGRTGVLPPPYQLKAANSEEEAGEEVAAAEPTQLMATGSSEDSGGNDDSSTSSIANSNNTTNTVVDNLQSPLSTPIQLKATNTEEEAGEEVPAAEPTQLMATGAAEDPGGGDDSSPSSNANNNNNNTGLPDNLKSGIEGMSGLNMNDVKVHYNSPKPAKLSAHAYAQGSDIHLGSGQEKHLPHEAWHVVQQKQGRVKPTVQLKGVDVNDNIGLEKEATAMGEKAVKYQPTSGSDEGGSTTDTMISGPSIAQMAFSFGEGWVGSQTVMEKAWYGTNTAQDTLTGLQGELNRDLAQLTNKVAEIKGHNYYKNLQQFVKKANNRNFQQHKEKLKPLEAYAVKWNATGENAISLDHINSPTERQLLRAHIETAQEILSGFPAFLPDAEKQTGREQPELASMKGRLDALTLDGSMGNELPKTTKEGKKKLSKNFPTSSSTSLVGSGAIETTESQTAGFEGEWSTARESIAEKDRIKAEETTASDKAAKERIDLGEKLDRINGKIGSSNMSKWSNLFDEDLDDIETAMDELGGGLKANQLFEILNLAKVKKKGDIAVFKSLQQGIEHTQLFELVRTLSQGQDANFLARIWTNAGGAGAPLDQLKNVLRKVNSTQSNALESLSTSFNMGEIGSLLELGDSALLSVQNLLTQPNIDSAGISRLLAGPAASKMIELLGKIPNSAKLVSLATAAGTSTKVDILIKDLLNNPTALAAAQGHADGGADMNTINADDDVAAARGLKTNAGVQIETISPAEFATDEERDAVKSSVRYARKGGQLPVLNHDGAAGSFGETFNNNEGRCPGQRKAGGYKKYYVKRDPSQTYAPDKKHGGRRIVKNDVTGHIYYSANHYTTMKRLLI